MNTKEGHVNVTGGKIWYKISSPEINNVPLLIIHGGPGATHDIFEPLEKIFNKRPLIFYDQLGSGNSDRPDDNKLWNINRFIDELEILIKYLGYKKYHLLGHSFGSMLVVDFILTKKPDYIKSLILSGPCLNARLWGEDQRKYLEQMPEKTKKIIVECEKTGNFDSKGYQDAMITYYKKHVCNLNPWPECLNRSFNKMGINVYKFMWGPSEFTITGTLKDYDRTDRLKEIEIPTLFTCGEFDEATPKTTSFYSSLLKNSEIAVLKGASHIHMLERPEEYVNTAENFLQKHDL